MKHYISVTIGRNVGNQPMTLNDWKIFKTKVKRCIINHQVFSVNNGTIFEGDGEGFWSPDHEDSHALIFLQEIANVDALKRDLAKLASQYQQEAIGCAIVPLVNGDETLIMAE